MKNPHASALGKLGKGKPKTKTAAGHEQRKTALAKARAKLASLRGKVVAVLLALTSLTAYADTPAELHAALDANRIEALRVTVLRVQQDGFVGYVTSCSYLTSLVEDGFTGYAFITGHPKMASMADGEKFTIFATRNGVVTAGRSQIRAYTYKSDYVSRPETKRQQQGRPALGATGVATRKSERVR